MPLWLFKINHFSYFVYFIISNHSKKTAALDTIFGVKTSKQEKANIFNYLTYFNPNIMYYAILFL